MRSTFNTTEAAYPPHLVDAVAAATYLTREYGHTLAPGTIRTWARRGHIHRHGRDRRGRTLYNLIEVQSRALSAWGIGAG